MLPKVSNIVSEDVNIDRNSKRSGNRSGRLSDIGLVHASRLLIAGGDRA